MVRADRGRARWPVPLPPGIMTPASTSAAGPERTGGTIGEVSMAGPRGAAWAVAVWTLTRAALLLCVFHVVHVPGPDVTSDVSGIYHGWFDVLRSGTYPMDDVTWQYPPAAAFAILAPALLPRLSYTSAF